MSECECLAGCPFFNDKMANMPGMSQMLKDKYCHADWQTCARHRIFEKLGREAVPDDLFPNQVGKVDEILQAVAANR